MLVAVTGYGRAEDLRRSREAGFDHHLVKPVDLEPLRSLITAGTPNGHQPTGEDRLIASVADECLE